MPSRIDEAGHTKAFDDPVAEHWGERQRAKRSLVGLEPTSAHTYVAWSSACRHDMESVKIKNLFLLECSMHSRASSMARASAVKMEL